MKYLRADDSDIFLQADDSDEISSFVWFLKDATEFEMSSVANFRLHS